MTMRSDFAEALAENNMLRVEDLRATPPPPGVSEVMFDLDGNPYRVTDALGAWRVTECCHAFVTYCEGVLCCKGCYAEQDIDVDQKARLPE